MTGDPCSGRASRASLARGLVGLAALGLAFAGCTTDTGGRAEISAGGSGGTSGAAGLSGAAGQGGAGGASSGGVAGGGAAGGSAASGGVSGSGGSGGSGGSAGVGGAAGVGGSAGAGGGAGLAGSAGIGGVAGAAGSGGGGPLTVDDCFAGQFVSDPGLGPNYDQFSPVIGSHCKGTNHQQISGVRRVVFLGDSVTVGTPPTLGTDFYRTRLANRLATRFGLTAPGPLWENADVVNGTSIVRESGDFASCAKWGARADDLLKDNSQIEDCIPADKRDQNTLVVLTMGGNDIASITQAGIDGKPVSDIWNDVHAFVSLMREAVWWFKEPGRFPNGVSVVFANMFEFTDGTGDVSACPAAGLAGFGAAWADPSALAAMVIWANEQFMDIAVETQTDMVFMLESFCGHGFNSGNPSAPCYRGPGSANWFDLTCIHPNPTGHKQLADLFSAVINE